MIELSDNMKHFIREIFPALVGTKRPNGSVHMNPIWFEYQDGYFWLNSFRGAKWLENVERDGEVTLALIDPHNMYRYAEVRGRLVEATEEGADEHIDRLSIRYRGEPYNRSMAPNQVRVRIQIEPERIIGSIDWQPPRPPAQVR